MPNVLQPTKLRAGARARGFTLIEILVVITILAIMGAVVVPKLIGRVDEARISAAKLDINNLKSALNMYKLDNQRYPTTDQGLQALVTKPTSGPEAKGWRSGYIEKLPADPWKNPYQYIAPGTHGTAFDIFSYGADGQPGGTGDDADIGSWEQ